MSVDLVISQATIYDGSGAAPVTGDVAVAGGRIVSVGRVAPPAGAEVIDAAGLCVAPGFIDLHTHSDGRLARPGGSHSAENHLRQGVTTIVTGNCGFGTVDTAGYLAGLDETGVGVNVLHLIGHGSVRKQVMGVADRPATDDEMARMKRLVGGGMDAGAVGMSTGLIYVPGTFATTEEIIELAKVAARRGGIYASHIRGEAVGVLDAVAEAIRVGREAGCRVQISHFKTVGPRARGLGPKMCDLVEAARSDGAGVSADQYPYEASSTDLASMVVPASARDNLEALLGAEDTAASLKASIAEWMVLRGGARGQLITEFEPRRQWEGMTLAAVAEALGVPAAEACVRILRMGNPSVVSFGLNEEDMKVIMPKAYVATGSDGSFDDGSGLTHPRSYGTFPRKIGVYARDRGWLTVEGAIRSATGLPADILGLGDRGYVRPGCVADLVVFDLAELTDRATYLDPRQFATGFKRVYVGGQAAVVDDAFTGVLAGRALRRQGADEPAG